jgi:hypothetical protein
VLFVREVKRKKVSTLGDAVETSEEVLGCIWRDEAYS